MLDITGSPTKMISKRDYSKITSRLEDLSPQGYVNRFYNTEYITKDEPDILNINAYGIIDQASESFKKRMQISSHWFKINNEIIGIVLNSEDDSSFPLSYFNRPAYQDKFSQLAAIWKAQTSHISNITKKCSHPAYQQIIGMGEQAIEPILSDLKGSYDDWFWALTAITGNNPINEKDAGNIKQMAEAWLQWGRSRGYNI